MLTEERLAKVEEKVSGIAQAVKDIATTLKELVRYEAHQQEHERRIANLEGVLSKLVWGIIGTIGAIAANLFFGIK
jgi:DNA topoisomerase VI subunit B